MNEKSKFILSELKLTMSKGLLKADSLFADMNVSLFISNLIK